jgi:tetratricopeptide (TPR) repeat protein
VREYVGKGGKLLDYRHPTPAEMEELMQGGLSAQRARAVILHLVRGCEACNLEMARYLPPLLGPASSLETPPSHELDVYDAALDRAFAGVSVQVHFQRSDTERRQPEGLEALQDTPSDLQGLPLYEALLERSWALRHDDPDQMVRLARSAALLADGLNESEIGPREAADLRCRAWAELANAYRVADELDWSQDALNRATSHLVLGTRNEILSARFLDVVASYFAARRSFDLASTTLDIVATIYRRHGDPHLAGRALIMKGIFIGYSGEAERAIHSIQQGLSTVDERRDAALVFSALQCQARLLVDCGRLREAHWALWSLRQRNLDGGGRMNELKVRWLEGQISVGLEEFDHAEQALADVKQGFEEVGLGYKAALAGLELGAVWLRQGRFQDAEKIVLACADAFLSLQIRRELMAAILMLRQAAEARYLSLSALQRVISLLREEDRDSKAPPLEEP